MAQILSAASALQPGHDLWVIAGHPHSRWGLILDWYLNFQVLRGQQHQPHPLPGTIQTLLRETDLPAPRIPVSNEAPLLVAAEGRLPSKWVLHLTRQTDAGWIRALAEAWKELGSPSIRLFLPKGVDESTFRAEWAAHATSTDNLALVLDQETASPGQ